MQGGDDSGGVYTLGRYDEYSPRALYLAAAQGHVDMCRLLLGAQFTCFTGTKVQELAKSLSCLGHVEMCRLLLGARLLALLVQKYKN